ncbi:hypothetical protein LMH87_002865 [Akanthomyces muscarius]|uniref:N-acetyltransferase domain-containing protein n=1 Tax=Akanthomyces muscarius TaxID=2231603 RepID=A0A9W8Q7X5_AKAMU|nr:hypothetical protein LMH87_002865 [Akanthomyces muscarius]KAJ4148392.1 hypothetical protein LMH87_002865 [Akanthomyces muscarius]
MTSMQVMTDSFRNVFKSERLVYTALDETDRSADAEEPEPIGFVVLGKSFPECAEYSLGFLQEHLNKGYGREAIRWAANYAFTWCNLHRAGDAKQWLPRSYYFKDVMNAWRGDIRSSIEWK